VQDTIATDTAVDVAMGITLQHLAVDANILTAKPCMGTIALHVLQTEIAQDIHRLLGKTVFVLSIIHITQEIILQNPIAAAVVRHTTTAANAKPARALAVKHAIRST
tara:strand:+ start:3895 stop:4215 length:321 start_codon:yes stop_codon:yes gene_type:complete